MSTIDWVVLGCTLLFIVLYGLYKSRATSKSMEGYLLGGSEAKWWTVGLSVMATQASAITFLSTPGQAFHSGMGFVQFYFGLPLAMIVICITFIPIYKRLKVYTAYEYLEQRFDLKTRTLAAILFLVQRGLAAGITIYAPAIILSTIIGWNLNLTILVIGVLVIIYTVSGGTKAVSMTQKQQMFIMMGGMFIAFMTILNMLPEDVGFFKALEIAGANDRMQVLDFSFDPSNRYTVWTGLIGGFFVALSYFGTDQSQVQRYLSGKSIKESQLGLIFNGLLKVPMQFFILLVGIMVFIFYQFNSSPVFFNPSVVDKVLSSEHADAYLNVEQEYRGLLDQKSEISLAYAAANDSEKISLGAQLAEMEKAKDALRNKGIEIIKQADPDAETNDKDYVFIHFILNQLPIGLVGLLLAVIFSAAMSSTASELNALGSTTSVDLYRRNVAGRNEEHYLKMSKVFTLLWGVIAILFATFGTLAENLIQLVNIIGSIFYGTILGVFLLAFYIKKVKSNATFIAALISQALIILIFWLDVVSYLWLNVIGCLLVMAIAFILQQFMKKHE